MGQGAYLIFVIFSTQTRFLENKMYTEECVNYHKRISRQNSKNRDLLDQANNKYQDHEKKGNYTLCVKAVYHWMGVKQHILYTHCKIINNATLCNINTVCIITHVV